MPSLRKLEPEEVATVEHKRSSGVRARVTQEYDGYLAEFQPGEYGIVELVEEECRQKTTVRSRLKAAAKRKGCTLHFVRTPGNAIIFKAEGPSYGDETGNNQLHCGSPDDARSCPVSPGLL